MIKAISLGKRYGVNWVFKDINFELKKGEIIIITGENGCGKTTLLKILAGLLLPSEGSIETRNVKKIGYIAHDTPFFPDLSLKGNIEFWSKIDGVDSDLLDKKLTSLLQKVELISFWNQKIRDFSQGMVKRAEILRLILMDPDIYLLDEPTSGLDPKFQLFFIDLVKKAKIKNKIVLWVTHDKEHINYGDKLLKFKNGTIDKICLKGN